MKKIGLFAAGLLLALPATAQEKKDDFSSFMEEQLADFDKFLDDANQEFINFMRDPWKEFEAEKPVEKRTKPEPVKPVVYDEKKAPKDEKPVCLTIEEILDLSTEEGKQKPVVKVNDVEDITFDEPTVIVKKKKKPTVIVVEEKPGKKPAVEPEKKPVAEEKPVVQPEKKPVAEEKPVAQPVKKPVAEEKPAVQPEKKPVVEVEPVEQKPAKEPERPVEVKPAPAPKPVTPAAKPARKEPLYAGGADRSKIVYGTQAYYLPNGLKGKCRLNSLKENDVADAYEGMYATDYKNLLKDCRQIASDLSLNDWGVFTLLRTVADAYCSNANESVVMQQFLLNEMGYKAKMARKADENKMLLFVATDCQIYGHPYMQQGGLTYYNINGNQPCAFYMCQKDAPSAKNSLQMALQEAPAFEGATASSTHQAKGSAAKVTVEVPKTLMDFYKSYPQCDYSVYVNAPVNEEVAHTLLSSLAPLVKGKSEADAANLLINFVQTGFQYATDGDQFGYEKPFFVEELFYYPYCDCEDRSILYSYLVRNLLGLDVVLLDYPDHIATAVRFNSNVGGDYLMVGGQKYTVCDPTYIGASIGMTMPVYKTVAAKVLKY